MKTLLFAGAFGININSDYWSMNSAQCLKQLQDSQLATDDAKVGQFVFFFHIVESCCKDL